MDNHYNEQMRDAMTQYCFGIQTWSGNTVVPLTMSDMEHIRRGQVVVPEDGEENRAKIFAQSLEGWRIKFTELGLSEKEVYVKIEAMVSTHLSLLNAAEAVEYTRERASIWASKIEEQGTAFIDLGVTEENLDCLIECIRNIHMVPFAKISGFFPNPDEATFLKIQDLLRLDRPNRKITRSSMEAHSDREGQFTTIGILRDTAKYRIYPIVDKAFSKEYVPTDTLEAIRIVAEPKDLIVMGPVVLARTNEQSNVPANLPHAVTSATGAYRLLAH